jgi:hypothetical protein
MKKLLLLAYFFCFSLIVLAQAVGDYGSLSGDWSDPNTWRKWDGTAFTTTVSTVPTTSDNVWIVRGTTVTLDPAVANCKDLNVLGTLYTSKIQSDSLTVLGNIFVDTSGTFKAQTNTIGANLRHVLALHGNLTNIGFLDFRNGTNGSTLGVVHTYFVGSTNSVVTMTAYSAANNDFSAVTLNKTGGANLVLGSDMVMNQGNSTNLPAQLIFVNGKIITNQYKFVHLSTSSADLVQPIPMNCWVVGEMGRGMSNSGGKTNFFPVGTMTQYRPITVKSFNGGQTSGHHVTVRVIDSAANVASPVFTNNIDKVSQIRYFRVGYASYVGGVPDTMKFDAFRPSYGLDDGVAAGNTNLRVAWSVDRKNWNGINQTWPHTTNPSDTARQISSDTLATQVGVKLGENKLYVALARVTGTTENTLAGPVGIQYEETNPSDYVLNQNYPNPFNPSTMISFSIPARALVSLKVYDALGREVSELLNGEKEAGTYNISFNASGLANGVYFYKLNAGSFSSVKKMILIK